MSKGIALCGKMEFKEATKAFDIAFIFTEQNSNTILLLLLIKACRSFFISFLLHPILRLLHFSMQVNKTTLFSVSKSWLLLVPAPKLLHVVWWK